MSHGTSNPTTIRCSSARLPTTPPPGADLLKPVAPHLLQRVPHRSTVEHANQLLGSDLPVRVLDDGGDLVPVDIDVEPHAEPPTRSDVRRSVEPRWILLDHRLLHARRR